MRMLYGPQFQREYGNTPDDNPLWLATIAELSDEECLTGVEKLRKQARGWPPNSGEFAEACRPRGAGVRYLGRPTTPDAAIALIGAIPATREQAAKHIASMRRWIGHG